MHFPLAQIRLAALALASACLLCPIQGKSDPIPIEPVYFDEAESGDLVNGLPYDQTTNVGTFALGLNTVKGELTGALSEDASDEFNFVIPEGVYLRRVTFRFSDVVSYSSFTPFIREIDNLAESTVIFDFGETVDVTSVPTTVSLFSSLLPLGAGIYQISTPGSFSFSDSDFLNLSYEWKFIVSRVPEPGTLALLSAGFLGMGFARRRKAA